MQRWRAQAHRQLSPEAWEGRGISPVNRALMAIILISIVVAVIQSEPGVKLSMPWLFAGFDIVFAMIFCGEFVARFWSAAEDNAHPGSTGRLRFVMTFSSILDMAAIAAILVDIFSGVPGVGGVILRLGRVVRVVALTKHSRVGIALRFLRDSVAERSTEILLSFSLAVLVLLFSSVLLYLAERHLQPDAFGSIPRAMWWAVATLTTVGYGDVYPISALGKFLAGVTAMTSIAVIAIPAGIMAAVFSNAIQKIREAREDRDWE